ncbi:cysteine proteinase [Rhizopogon vinicolor AM-OR11-026]|uniref:Ubiquitin carboxyl-terminal hydrolase n=1 Tax=Rhizopogon vinicolor AM-OR11-026 TaxID=1314800 RepID=A0A1B7N3U4_9AGAM|nr:cysteine proteinase [Rhizopogon vinicolor AM-OR11-026]
MAIGKWNLFGQPVQTTTDNPVPQPLAIPSADAKQFGLENFGNTCYVNSVLQALYFCSPFRDLVIQHVDPYATIQTTLSSQFTPTPTATPTSPTVAGRRKQPERKSIQVQDSAQPNDVANPPTAPTPSPPRTLISALRSLYIHISQNPADKGTIAPRAFIEKLKELNEAFRNTMHQDAHEFLNYLLNKIVEEIEEGKKLPHVSVDDSAHSVKSSSTVSQPLVMTASTSSSSNSSMGTTFIHQIFEGILTSETRCLTCENVSSRDESFLDLSIDIEQNSSVTACLRQFSASEMLCQKNKFFCDGCCDLQEAEKRMKIKRLPNVLALHLKRFKYQEDVQKYIKLAYRVAFPFELRLFNTIDDVENPDRLYELFAIVVHIGSGPNHGHYVSIIKTMGSWLVFDDETVDTIKESDIHKYFGESNAGSAYVLYYQAVDLDIVALDLPPTVPHAAEDHSHQRHPTDSPASLSQPIPLPPGLSVEPADAGNAKTAPLPPPPPLPVEVPVPPAEKLPHTFSSEFMPPSAHLRSATVGPGSSSKPTRHGILKHVPSLRIGADKRDTVATKPMSITPFPKGESPEPMSPAAALTSPNGKEKEIERKSGNWFRRKSLKSGAKSRPSLEVGVEKPPLPPDILLDMSASPTRFHTTGPAPKYSKDDGSRHPPQSAGLDRPVAPFMVNRRPVSASSIARISSQSTNTREGGSPSISDTMSYSSQTTSTSSSISSQSTRLLPSIPASPQNSKLAQSPPSAFHRGHSSEHPRPHRRPAISPSDFEPPELPKPSARPTTAGASLGSSTLFSRDRNLPSLPSAVADDPPGGKYGNIPILPHLDKGKVQAHAKTRASEEGAGFSGRPKSAHASTTLGTLQTRPSSSTNGNVEKRASRKLSFSASFPFGRKDKHREKEKV